jgi:nicotinamide-nucleotide amidase
VTSSCATAPRARLLLTGDELLRGFIQDANSGFLAAQLRDIGIELDQIRVIGDEFDVIQAALEEALVRDQIDLVLVTGGLGPTHDDRTSEAVARAIGVQPQLQADALGVVEARIRAYGRMRTPEEIETYAPGNRKQATMPAGATWVDPLGTAPGYVVAAGDAQVVVVLPGPPSELRHAWKGVVQAPQLATLRARVPHRHERLIRLWGISESRGSQVLAQLGHVDSDDRRVTICARDGELEISVRGADVASVDALIDGLASEFGDAAFALDESRGIVELVGDGLRARGWSLGLAESCTGGLLGQLVTSVAGASNWFAGSLVTYSNAAKVRVARVDPATLDAHGAVSEAVALELARGAREVLGTDVGIGITGVAGPGGGSDDKPVGTVHVAIVTPDGELHRRLHVPGNRETVRRRSCTIVLQELRGQLRRS